MAASPATSSSNSTSSFAATAPGFFCSGADLSNSFPPSHDIFISHSGMQKDFCTELYYHLNHNLYSTFLDITDHSLPLGQDFPSHIFAAARTCRLAVLVISEDYLLSKWPMLELSAFVFAPSPQPNILPLFFKLSPKDLKERHYRDKWQATWKEFKEADPDRIDLLKFNYAFDKLLSLNGIQLKQSEGEHAYIRRVCKEICQNLPPSLTHDFSGLHGLQRMSKAVLTEFEELTERSSNRPVYVVGMHGLPKSGKSTLCRYLCHRLFSLYAGKALHLELRTDATEEELLVNAKELLTRLSDFNNKLNLARVSNLRQIYQQLKSVGFSSMRLLLIVDNITSPESIDFVQSLLRLGLGAGSGVLLVARTCNTLYSCLPRYKDTNHHAYALCPSMPAPRLNNREALRVLLQAVDAVDLPDTYEPEHCLTPAQLELAEKVVRMCANEWGHHLPLVLELVGKQLRDNGLQDKNDFVKEVWWFKEKALESLLALGFRKLRQKQKDLFLDIALFILPLSYSQNLGIKQTCYYLGLIHGRTPLEIELELKELQKHSFAYNPPGEITIRREPIVRIHDVYLEFAASIDEATTYFWSSGQRWSKVKCPQAIEQVESCRLRTIVFEELERKELQFSRYLSSVRAMFIRNCRDLKTLKGLENLEDLQVLRLEETGIKELVCSTLPRLRVLELNERHIERLHVCNLPQLEEFKFYGGIKLSNGDLLFHNNLYHEEINVSLTLYEQFTLYTDSFDHSMESSPLIGKDFLADCPKLQRVLMHGASWDLTKHWPQFTVRNGILTVQSLPNTTLTGFERLSSLCELILYRCAGLTEISGLDGLWCLRLLVIGRCDSLRTVTGLTDLASLQFFDVGEDCPNLEVVALHQLVDSTQLKLIKCHSFCPSASLDGAQFSTGNFANLQRLELGCRIDCNLSMFTGTEGLKSLWFPRLQCCKKKGNYFWDKVDFVWHRKGRDKGVDDMLLQLTSLGSLACLVLDGLTNLWCFDGIKCFTTCEVCPVSFF